MTPKKAPQEMKQVSFTNIHREAGHSPRACRRQPAQEDVKNRSRGVSRDMSPEAIARRLDIASQLHELAKSLGKATKLDPAPNQANTKEFPHAQE